MELKLILVRERNPAFKVGEPFTTPEDIARRLGPLVADEAQEVFMVAVLDARHRYRGHHVVSRGSLTSSIVHPREVFKAALLRNAAAIVLLHNHPSGDAKASDEDIAVTRRLAHASEILGIRILDHLIVANGGGYSSMKEAGIL
jgi:DNA repair protein RadC